ncbi:MAG: DUF72 domain-containing protein [Solirubrobacteraceae bacterium]|nr:DUF72 domain-containing protein [Solirubrobacteraceae bacterium]
MSGRIVVGTSSWADPGFIKTWYPPGLPARDRLQFYADRYEGVEVNASFYAVPEVKTVERWVQITPPDFTFDFKLHRLLSRHSAPIESLPPDLRDLAETSSRGRAVLSEELEEAVVSAVKASIAPVDKAGKLSALLLQLSPSFAPKKHELAEIGPMIEAFRPHVVAVEFRHRGWVEGDRFPKTLAWLEEHGAAFVCTDSPQGEAPTMMPPVDAVTHPDVAYLRMHGRNVEGYAKGKSVAERFDWDYGDGELREIERRAEGLAEESGQVRMMFNNNKDDLAPQAATRMRILLGQDPGPPAGSPQGALI